ncbi:RHS repeat-associated protein [Stackebrandtia endophytica]|uniref:RHS repeat-associated protein n=1 Tax=Stackebrandtia endophytica TaxID=1496996 RepID=A0A543AS06_9ACTN|nr:LamG-like jellyroll fold domain-containing protein [Stackebrandtia endophytica]TQL75370.1 RHS repeat-associated protein [Stackebrandtia endophytica]
MALALSPLVHVVVMVALVAGLLATVPPAPPTQTADGVDEQPWPVGASSVAPEQSMGSADNLSHQATSDLVAPPVSVPDVPGAVAVSGPVFEEIAPQEVVVPEQSATLVDDEAVAPTGFVAGQSVEIISRRTETSTEFANPDGSTTLRMFEAQAFIEDDEGMLAPVDTDLIQSADGRWRPINAAEVSFAEAADDAIVMEFVVGEGLSVAYGMADAAAVVGIADGQEIMYGDVLPFTDLRYTAASWGAKEELVIHDAQAPSSWVFPLQLTGLSARVDSGSGAVEFIDASGTVQATMPPGFAEDANVDPYSGDGALSYDLAYEVVEYAGGQALRVSMDEGWLKDPRRVFPVTVDPQIEDGRAYGDTYVMKPYTNNYSGEGELKVGYVDGLTAAGLVKFNDTFDRLKNKYIQGATLNLYNTHSYSCNARSVKIHRITSSWAANSSMSWPGPKYESTALASKSFAHGYSSSCGRKWATFPINSERFTKWVHGQQSMYGFRIEASHSDKYGWKKFASNQTTIPSAQPFLDVVYADQAATYTIPTGKFDTPVTATQSGKLRVRVTNWGSATWQPGTGYSLRHAIYRADGTRVGYGTPVFATSKIGPHQTGDIVIGVDPLPAGSYRIEFSMAYSSGKWFSESPYNVPSARVSFKVSNLAPYITGNAPANGAQVNTLRPTLYVNWADPDTGVNSAEYSYKVCKGTPDEPSECQESGWQTIPSWQLPDGMLTWGETAFWYAQVSDGDNQSEITPPIFFTTMPIQPAVTSHLAGTSDAGTVPGLNPQVGNYTTTITDASVAAIGPALAAVRTYNSQDLRTNGAFGAGWSTPWDQKLEFDGDGSGSVLATLSTGRQVRFGHNTDRSYQSPLGSAMQLVADGTEYVLRDASGMTRRFDSSGALTVIVDPHGNSQIFEHIDGKLSTVTDDVSGRSLHLSWAGNHIATVATDSATTEGVRHEWTYSYDGDVLTSVCSPLAPDACTTYGYDQTSHYRSVIEDDNPVVYYTFDETDGTTATNVMASDDGDGDGLYHNVQFGEAGALPGSSSTSIDFSNSGSSAVTAPDDVFDGALDMAIELWFKAEPGQTGVLFHQQNAPHGDATNHYTPLLYVGTDGKLRSGFWMLEAKPNNRQHFISSSRVDNGQWHHVVLTSALAQQWLYLNGQLVGTESGRTLDYEDRTTFLIGTGYRSGGWPSTPAGSGYFDFTGKIDEVALYKKTLDPRQVAAHYQAGSSASVRLADVTAPGEHLLADVTYDGYTGRVTDVTDKNGATWQLSAPQVAEDVRTVHLSADYGKTETYKYDIAHSGRPISRTDATGTVSWEYNTAGFRSKTIDELGRETAFATDEYGNVLAVTTCRTETDCHTRYAGYFTSDNPLDPRNGQPLWSADARSSSETDETFRTTFTINAAGQRLSTTYPAIGTVPPAVETVTYSTGTEAAVNGGTIPAGLIVEEIGARGQATTHRYSSTGDLVESTDPIGATTRYTYDNLGRITAVSVGTGQAADFAAEDTTNFSYNPIGQVTQTIGQPVTNPITDITHTLVQTNQYDSRGLMVSTTLSDLTGDDQSRITLFTYDSAGRPITQATPDGVTTIQEWDTAGNVITQTTPTGLQLELSYDERGRLQTTTAVGQDVDPLDPLADRLTVESRAYLDNDLLASTTDAAGRTTEFDYYLDGLVHTTTVKAPDGTDQTVIETFDYDPAGNTTTYTGPDAITITYEYNERGWVSDETHAPGFDARAYMYVRDEDGNVIANWIAERGTWVREEKFTFDLAGNPLTQQHLYFKSCAGQLRCIGYDTSATYSERGELRSTTDSLGATETYEYDALARSSSITGVARDVWENGVLTEAVTPTSVNGYNTFGELTHEQDPFGAVTVTEYDQMGRPISVTLPEYHAPTGETITATTSVEYTADGQPQHVTDALGNTTSYTYDLYGRQTSVIGPDPDGDGSKSRPVWRYLYDRVGQEIQATDPTGAQVFATYDHLGRMITYTTTERVNGELAYFTTATEYDSGGRPSTVTTPGGRTTSYTYDVRGRKISETDPLGQTTTWVYKAPGSNTAVTTVSQRSPVDEEGAARSAITSYDAEGRPVSTTEAYSSADGTSDLRRCQQQSYDMNGNITGRTRWTEYCSSRPETTYEHNAAGQTVAITSTTGDGDPITVHLGYDRAGNQTRLVDGNGNVTEYTYNTWGLQESTIEPVTLAHPAGTDRTWTTVYDAVGNPVEQWLPGGVTRQATFDANGQLTGETGAGAEALTASKELGYDQNGRLASISGPAGDTMFTYNDRGLLTATTGANTASFSYDADGLLHTRTDAAGTTTFTYDAAGRIATISEPLTGQTHQYTWRQDGLLESIAYGQTTRSFEYDGFRRVAEDQVSYAGIPVASLQYEHDFNDQLTSKTITGLIDEGTYTYTYDDIGRLTSWTSPDGTTAYGWDAASNRITVTTEVGTESETTRTTSFDQRNRAISTTGANQSVEEYTYTARGTLANQTGPDGFQQYTFDAFERLTSIQTGQSTVVNEYDALDRLATRNGIAFEYANTSNLPVATPTSGTGTAVFARDPSGQVIATSEAGSAAVIWNDRHGDTIAVVNPVTGTIIGNTAYDPYGTATSTGQTTTIGFQGGYTDPDTGQVNAHARWYDPATSAFSSRDTWKLSPDPVAQTNRYTYGNGSPLNNVDTNGHAIAAVVGGALLAGPVGWVAVGVVAVIAVGGVIVYGEQNGWAWESSSSSGIRTGSKTRIGVKGRPFRPGSNPGSKPGGKPGGKPGSNGGNGGYGSPGGSGAPWMPAPPPPPPIDWNAHQTRPTGTAQQEADSQPDSIDLLNGALLGNDPAILDELEEAGIITVDPEGNVTGINWRDVRDHCKSNYFYGDAPGGKATGAAAYLCMYDLKDQGPGSKADDSIEPWGWPASGNIKLRGNQWLFARCHLIGHQLGGTGKDVKNLVTCFQYPTNDPNMKALEDDVRWQVEQGGEDILYISIPQYNGDGGTLSGIRVIAIGHMGYYQDQCFENKFPDGKVVHGGPC